jgi:hypothetical protein
MGWGDAATWVGCGVAIAAVIYSAKSLRLQRTAAEPAVEWKLERDDPSQRWGVFYLRNTGTLNAAGVTVTHPTDLASQLTNVDIAAKAAHPIVISFDMGERPAAHLMLTWQGQAEPVAVAIPPVEK